jgi:hypothetical protein
VHEVFRKNKVFAIMTPDDFVKFPLDWDKSGAGLRGLSVAVAILGS